MVGKSESKLKILAAGDFHGVSNIAEGLAEKAEKEKVDLIILTGDLFGAIKSKNIIKPFLSRGQKVIFIPGNWETSAEAKKIAGEYSISNIEDKYLKYKDVGIFGVGSANWALYPDDEEIFQRLVNENKKMKGLEKKIMISHIHAAGTKSELSGIPGSAGLRKAIEKIQPDFFISGHIHELEGVEEKIGKTKVINVGRRGRIIEV
jgi:Icc-related predicted phosphoesterase